MRGRPHGYLHQKGGGFMSIVRYGAKGETALLMGNDAIARGALEAGVRVVSGYPGNPPPPRSYRPWG